MQENPKPAAAPSWTPQDVELRDGRKHPFLEHVWGGVIWKEGEEMQRAISREQMLKRLGGEK